MNNESDADDDGGKKGRGQEDAKLYNCADMLLRLRFPSTPHTHPSSARKTDSHHAPLHPYPHTPREGRNCFFQPTPPKAPELCRRSPGRGAIFGWGLEALGGLWHFRSGILQGGTMGHGWGWMWMDVDGAWMRPGPLLLGALGTDAGWYGNRDFPTSRRLAKLFHACHPPVVLGVFIPLLFLHQPQ